ncbi:hypothetical protein F8M41_026145 [Gigaspora margarita]|uniref:Uncharacterized protein n=1 Tax=Gigaspora margarita TaxID=4874 RepID=A0A8H3XJ00_GIGMA|nr:hypothetical protein F8M41_026145 [Gigaspora margarita]
MIQVEIKRYLNDLKFLGDKLIGKGLTDEQLNEVLKEFQSQIENSDYKILQFWADVTKPHAENNTTDVLLNVQTAIYSCNDRIQLTTTINYLKNISEDQIKEIILRAEFKKKEKIIESYIKFPADTKPQWFFKNLKEIDNLLRQKLLELSITDPFYWFIVNFNSEIWQSIYSKNAILRLESDDLFQFSMEQYDNINNVMDSIFAKYDSSLEPSPQIELNSDLDELLKEYCKAIMKTWLLEWINPPAVILEARYVQKYVYHPLNIVLDELLQHYHLHGPEHPATCTGERKSSHHQPPFGFPSTSNHAQEYFKDIDNKEGKLLSEEINLRVYPRKKIMKENYETISKIIQELGRDSSQEGSIQAFEYLQQVIRPTPALPIKCR